MNIRPPKDENLNVTDPEDVARIMQKILLRQNKIHRQKEYFWTIGLNTASDIVYIELVALGALNQVAIDPVEIFHIAVNKKCKNIILVHNHPSGNLKPSAQDKNLTRSLIKAADILKIKVLDHIIITETGFKSFIKEV